MKTTPTRGVPGSDISVASVRRITGGLLAAVAALLVLHVLCLTAPSEMSIATLRMVLDEFHLDREANVPNWFSSTLLAAAAALMIGIGVRARQRGERLGRRWIVMGMIFVLLSLDEAASFHEMAIHPLRDRFQLTGIFYFAWIIPALAVLTLLAVMYLPFVLALPARTRLGLIAAAALYLSGTIGMEMLAGAIVTSEGGIGNTAFAVSATIEEMLELLGLVLLLNTLMMHAFVRHESSAASPVEGEPAAGRAGVNALADARTPVLVGLGRDETRRLTPHPAQGAPRL